MLVVLGLLGDKMYWERSTPPSSFLSDFKYSICWWLHIYISHPDFSFDSDIQLPMCSVCSDGSYISQLNTSKMKPWDSTPKVVCPSVPPHPTNCIPIFLLAQVGNLRVILKKKKEKKESSLIHPFSSPMKYNLSAVMLVLSTKYIVNLLGHLEQANITSSLGNSDTSLPACFSISTPTPPSPHS